MIDIETLLQKQNPTPSRELRADFVEVVVANITPRQKETIMQKMKRLLHSRMGILSAAGVLVVGGTAAAITLWPTPKVTQTTSTQLPSGNHIVGYDTENCNYYSSPSTTVTAQKDEKVFYEVRSGSKLTDDELTNGLQGICEEDISNEAISRIEKELPPERRGDSSFAYTVNAVSSGSLTLTMDPHYSQTHVLPNQTYTRFDKNLLVYVQNNKGSFGDIKVGDTVKLITKDTSGRSAESPDETYVPANHPENQVVEAIIKIPALTGDPYVLFRAFATDIVRLDPCTTSPTGFCRAYDFTN